MPHSGWVGNYFPLVKSIVFCCSQSTFGPYVGFNLRNTFPLLRLLGMKFSSLASCGHKLSGSFRQLFVWLFKGLSINDVTRSFTHPECEVKKSKKKIWNFFRIFLDGRSWSLRKFLCLHSFAYIDICRCIRMLERNTEIAMLQIHTASVNQSKALKY